jgi:uncharacterized membrane protein YeaQ/YmgE (transglycosylase-associated protein family)
MDCLGLIGVIILAAVAGWFADMVIPGKMPYGWIGGVAAGIIGGLLASFLPVVAGIRIGPGACFGSFCYDLIPGIIGAIIFAFLVRFLMGRSSARM